MWSHLPTFSKKIGRTILQQCGICSNGMQLRHISTYRGDTHSYYFFSMAVITLYGSGVLFEAQEILSSMIIYSIFSNDWDYIITKRGFQLYSPSLGRECVQTGSFRVFSKGSVMEPLNF